MPPGGRRHGRYWIARFNARSRTGGVEVLPGLGSDLPVGLETAASLNGTYGDVGTFSELAVDGECVVVVGVQQALNLPHLRADHALGHDPGAVPVVAAAGAAGGAGRGGRTARGGSRGCGRGLALGWTAGVRRLRFRASWPVESLFFFSSPVGVLVGAVLFFGGRGVSSTMGWSSSGCGVRPGRCWCRSCSAGSGVRGCRRCGVWGCCRRHRALRPCRGSWRRGRDGGGATAGACRPGGRGRAGGRPPFRGGGLPEGRAGGGARGRRGGTGKCGGGPGRGVRRGGRPGS